MTSDRDLAAVACDIVDSNAYMTLATADRDGNPWASPVWYAHAGYREFLWVSRPDARHSRNLAARPQLGIVIFDSTASVGAAQAVYVEAVAKELTGADRDEAIALYSRRSENLGARQWASADVIAPAALRFTVRARQRISFSTSTIAECRSTRKELAAALGSGDQLVGRLLLGNEA